jgi:sodium-dependent dicarboxylate transporter 2/3/5
MLPVSTPPNAIAFAAAKMKPDEMVSYYVNEMISEKLMLVRFQQMKAGWFIKLVCVVVICVTMETWGNVVFGSKHFPIWANVTTSGLSQSVSRCADSSIPFTSPNSSDLIHRS